MAKKQYIYQTRRVPAAPRNKRLTDAIQEAGAAAGNWGSGPGAGGSVTVEADFDVLPGDGIDVEKNTAGQLTYTVSHSDTSYVDNTANEDVYFIQNLQFDDFGHVTEVESARITTGLDHRYLRKDIDDTAHGNILFDQRIGSTVFLDGMKGKGWEILGSGAAQLEAVSVRGNAIVGRRAGSEVFISGFPNGKGWDLGPYKRFNAAATEETKYRLELDDLVVRGKMRVFEMIVSQLRGENDNVIFAGQMKVAFYDAAERRLYLDTDRGILYNPFRAGDVLMVQRFGGMPSAGKDYNVVKQYELRVEEAGIGTLSDGEDRLDWITFSNFAGELSDIAEGDVLTRVDSVSDSTRKGLVKITTIDEAGAPYIDVVYGLKTDPDQATKVRIGNLSGIRTRNHADLTGVWGLYAQGAVLENSTFYLENGMTVEQQFAVMNGELNSKIETVKNDLSLEPGNILRNSSFATDLHDWSIGPSAVHFIRTGEAYLWMNDAFYVEKESVADVYQDGSKQVLRLRNSSVAQENGTMNGEKPEGTYSFSFFYKVLRAGTLSAGIAGTDLYIEQSLGESNAYRKVSHRGRWSGTGDFVLRFTGEILIYGVSLFNDALADATLKLQTQIQQNAERISLSATKEYVDQETGFISQKFDSQLKVQADEISQRVTKTEYQEGTNVIKREWESKLSVQADRISAVSTEVDNINHTISSAGWITTPQANTLYASKTLENGNKIISYINQTATTTTISASKINLQGAVSFAMLSDYTTINNRINGKADVSDVTNALKQYVTSSDLTKELKGYALASSLSNLVSSSYLSSTLAGYATNSAADAKAKAEAKAAFNTLTDAMINGKTTVLGGLISAKVLDVDSIFAAKATIGGFKINQEDLSSLDGYMSLSPSGIRFSQSAYEGAFGSNVLAGSTGTRGCVYLRNTYSSSGNYSNGACIFMMVGKSVYATVPQTWISCTHHLEGSPYSPYGWGSRFIVESRYFNDANGMERTVINVGNLMTSRQLESFQSGSHSYLPVYYDATTGYLCARI